MAWELREGIVLVVPFIKIAQEALKKDCPEIFNSLYKEV
tara:strand:- start:2946 stop:3062 length:117 start_codon:yes stop_codon:yes gene_type:complete